jgi:transposase
MHALKEGFRDIFETKYSQEKGLLKLLDWIHDAIFFSPKVLVQSRDV